MGKFSAGVVVGMITVLAVIAFMMGRSGGAHG